MNIKTYAIINDVQIPYQDKKVLSGVVKFIQDLKPVGIIMNGDIIDCYPISDFTRNPINTKTLQTEVDQVGDLMRQFSNIEERIWIGGNHEDRWRRYLWNKAPELVGVDGLEFEQIFQTGKYGFQYKPYGEHIWLGKLLVTHGSMVSSHSGISAKRHLDKYGTSVIIGHTHRMGSYYQRNLRGIHVAYENGCLCKLSAEYVQYPNWQQGFSVVNVADNGMFSVQQIPVLPGRQIYFGKDLIQL